jgi:hypothetical protein
MGGDQKHEGFNWLLKEVETVLDRQATVQSELREVTKKEGNEKTVLS